MTFLDFLRLTRANALLILGAITAGVLSMFVYTLQQPILYTATTQGYVVVGVATTAGELLTNANLQEERAEAYSSLINDRRVAERVTEKLGLDAPPEAIAGALSAGVVGSSGQIDVSASSSSPAQARDLANAGVQALAEVALEVQNAGLAEGGQESTLVKLSPSEAALLPGGPSSPDYQRNLLMGAAVGLAFGFGLAFLRRSVDRKVRAVTDIEGAGIGAVIGIIPAAEPLARNRWRGTVGAGQSRGPRGPGSGRRAFPSAAHQPALR